MELVLHLDATDLEDEINLFVGRYNSFAPGEEEQNGARTIRSFKLNILGVNGTLTLGIELSGIQELRAETICVLAGAVSIVIGRILIIRIAAITAPVLGHSESNHGDDIILLAGLGESLRFIGLATALTY